MAHKLDMTNGRANIAFKGSRENVWHRLGTEMSDGMSTDEWAKAAGMDWEAVKVPAVVELSGPTFTHLDTCERTKKVEGWNHLVRSDNGHPLGYVSDGYVPVNPREILNWFERYISVDDRFSLDVAGCLKKGEIVWATATYNGTMDVGGSAHVARVLMRTTYDTTGATINMGTMTRVVCDNTMRAAIARDKGAIIRTRHSTRFNAAKVGKELADVCKSFEEFKAMGDALATNEMVASEVSDFFKKCLDIPFDAKEKDLTGRKLNMFHALNAAYRATVNEGTEIDTAWTALNAVTRYVDHERSTRGGESVDEARMLSSMFGSGAALKDKALGLLLPRIKEKVLA